MENRSVSSSESDKGVSEGYVFNWHTVRPKVFPVHSITLNDYEGYEYTDDKGMSWRDTKCARIPNG